MIKKTMTCRRVRYACYVLTALAWLGLAKASIAQQILVVSPTPGNPIASGMTLLAVHDGISDNDSSHRYVGKVEPGVYNLAGNQLRMRPFIDIEGSGRGVTTIQGTASSYLLDDAMVVGADHTELRALSLAVSGPGTALGHDSTVEARVTDLSLSTAPTGPGGFGVGLWAQNSAVAADDIDVELIGGATTRAYGVVVLHTIAGITEVPSLRHIRVSGVGQPGFKTGFLVNASAAAAEEIMLHDLRVDLSAGEINTGFEIGGGTIVVERLNARIRGGSSSFGVRSTRGVAQVLASRLEATGSNGQGIVCIVGCTMFVDASQAYGNTYAANGAGASLSIGASLLSGPVRDARCIGTYDINYGAIDCL